MHIAWCSGIWNPGSRILSLGLRLLDVGSLFGLRVALSRDEDFVCWGLEVQGSDM